jgi:hypothetical protein
VHRHVLDADAMLVVTDIDDASISRNGYRCGNNWRTSLMSAMLELSSERVKLSLHHFVQTLQPTEFETILITKTKLR